MTNAQEGVHTAEVIIDNGSFGTRKIRFETGRLARLAAGSAVVYLDDETMVLSATTMSQVASSSWVWVGKATHWPLIRATRTPPIGPENGRPDSCVESEAALIATTS